MLQNGKRANTGRLNLIARLPIKSQMLPKSETRAIHREKYEIVREFARQCTHQTSIKPPRNDERKSRCSSPTSNASLAWPGSDYAAHTASKMNLPSQQPPKTFGNSLNSSRLGQPQVKGRLADEQPNEINAVTSINGAKKRVFQHNQPIVEVAKLRRIRWEHIRCCVRESFALATRQRTGPS